MISIYERITDFLLGKLQGKTLEYIIITCLLCFIFFYQNRQLEHLAEAKNGEIQRVIDDFRQAQRERDAYLQSYIDCEKSTSAHVRERLENIERMLQRMR